MIGFSAAVKKARESGAPEKHRRSRLCAIAIVPALALTFLFACSLFMAPTPAYAKSEIRLKAASANGRNIDVGLNKSVVIETPSDVRDVLVSSPAIADAVVRTPRRVYYSGHEDRAGQRYPV